MNNLLQPAIEQTDSVDQARDANAAFAKLRETLPPREYLPALLRAFGELREECRIKEQFYRCRGETELAMRFENASRAGLAASIAMQLAFEYEREDAIRREIVRESKALES